MPGAQAQQLVQADAHKEAVLKRVYGLEVTSALIKAEVQRLQAALAPQTFAEIQRALGNDPERFARSMARPLVVERLLHKCFDGDDKIQAPLNPTTAPRMPCLRRLKIPAQSQPPTWTKSPGC